MSSRKSVEWRKKAGIRAEQGDAAKGDKLQSLGRLEPLEQLESLESREPLERLEQLESRESLQSVGTLALNVNEQPILVVDGLTLESSSGQKLVEGMSFTLRRGESIGLVGESGSGKSLTLRAVLGLLPRGVQLAAGAVQHTVSSAMVFQDPRGALDPLCPVVKQVAEVVRYRQKKGRREARAEALKLLGLLGLPESLAREDRYPNQLSGGQCQRIVIAIALACRPDILLCDEPTTALDVTVQRQIIDLIATLQQELGFAMIFVTHNLAIAAEMCSRLIVMKQGRVVEEGLALDVLTQPNDPYTQMLIEAVLPLPERAETDAGAEVEKEANERSGAEGQRIAHAEESMLNTVKKSRMEDLKEDSESQAEGGSKS